MLIVESLADKKRFPAYGNEKIISLGDIAMYTDTEDVPLKEVFLSMKKKENGAAVVLDLRKLLLTTCVLTWQRYCLPSIATAYIRPTSRN